MLTTSTLAKVLHNVKCYIELQAVLRGEKKSNI